MSETPCGPAYAKYCFCGTEVVIAKPLKTFITNDFILNVSYF